MHNLIKQKINGSQILVGISTFADIEIEIEETSFHENMFSLNISYTAI